mgnify:CR=1 FL=1
MVTDSIKEINDRFNEELSKQIDGTLPKGHIYRLGKPCEILLKTGFQDLPIELSSTRLEEKSQNVIVGLSKDNKNFVIGIFFNQLIKGNVVSSVRGLFYKNNSEWLNWIVQGKALYLNKKKIQILIDQQRTNLADVAYLDLNLVESLIEDFVNP